MASYTPQYYSTSAVPIPTAPGKDSQYGYYPQPSSYSVSPPEGDHSVVSSGGGTYSSNPTATVGGAHVCSSSSCTGYGDGHHQHHHHQHHHHDGGSACCDGECSAGSASGVDFNEYMQERFADTFDPIPLDRSLAVQAQTSGNLNAKHRELLELQAKAQARLAKTRARFADGLQDAQEVRSNLEWTSKRVSSLKKKAEKKHSKEYQKARERYPSPEY
ncbi:hypothetical protein F5X99DRAFT_102481 [Biscogniauxia marginata]|nr:hypothetical protein F5X99DRAFT_102481 [Biscogniauxia marginata]